MRVRDYLAAFAVTLLSVAAALAIVDVIAQHATQYDGPIYAPLEPVTPRRHRPMPEGPLPDVLDARIGSDPPSATDADWAGRPIR